MSTLLDEPPATSTIHPAARLRTTMAAVRIAFIWFGVRKTLTAEQKAQAADTFGAEGEFLSAGKKLLDTRHPAFKAVTAVRGRILSVWKGLSLPYPESGIRLIRQDDIGTFDVQMTTLKAELDEAVEKLDEHYNELRSAARDRLGRLFNPADYPVSLRGLFAASWDFPSIEPPPYLQQLSPQLYQQECQRVQARFDEAVQLAEQAFTDELAKLVSHLTERLSGQEDGKPKIFRVHGGRKPDRVFRAVPAFECPFQRATRRAGGPGPGARSVASSPRSCAIAPTCGSTWPRNWPASRPRSTGC